MRLKAEAVFELWSDDDRHPTKIVREYRDQYKVIGEILDEHPKILEMAHRDLEKLSKATSRRGRAGSSSTPTSTSLKSTPPPRCSPTTARVGPTT